MLSGIRLYTGDNIWRKILTDLCAVIVDDVNAADLNIDSIQIPESVSPMELKSMILNSIDKERQEIIKKIFGRNVVLPELQMQIVVRLFKAKGMSAKDLKSALGYAPDFATHTIDTAIYQLRKAYGYDFIKNEQGKYTIGKL